MSILRHFIGAACELLTIKDPYDNHTYVPPQLVSETRDSCGHVVQQTIRAQNHADATRHLQGHTIQGDRSVVATRIGPNTWNVHVEDWRTQGIAQKFDDPRHKK